MEDKKDLKKEEKLLDAITDISDEIIDETSEKLNLNKKVRKTIWLKFGALAACLAVVSAVLVIPNSFNKKKSEPNNNDFNSALLTVNPLIDVIYPEPILFDDYDAKFALRETFPLEENFTKSVNDFSLKTASSLMSNSKENLIFSPTSLYFALAIATSGADGETEKEMLALLGVDSKETLAEQCKNLYNHSYSKNDIGNLKIGNSIWLQDGINFKDEFVKNTAENFYASSFNVDFGDPQTAQNMSAWVSKETNGLINPIIIPGNEQVLSIMNTIYFNDQWVDKFDERKTAEDDFHLANGETVKIDFMNEKTEGIFRKGDGYTTSARSLKNSGSVYFVLPDEGVTPQELASNPKKLNEALFGGEQFYGDLTWKVPKMELSSKLQLNDTLKSLGVNSAFSGNADFSQMTDGQTFINNINQEVKIKINENGVEASSFTEIDYAGAAMPQGNAEMILDRPFIYAITGNNGNILFIGICENPLG